MRPLLRIPTIRRWLTPLLLALAIPVAAHGQRSARSSAGAVVPEGHMQAFLRTLLEEPRDSIAAFFPRRGDWTWVQTYVDRPGRAGVWRFPAGETLRAIGMGGPLCMSFDHGGGEVGSPETALVMQAMGYRTGWRHLGGNRFAAPEGEIGSYGWVEWRREDGRWVVSRIGDGQFYEVRLLGTSRDLARSAALARLPGPAAYAEHEPWFTSNEPIVFASRRYVKYGRPRPIPEHELTRVGARGRVLLYAAARRKHDDGVIYVPVRPGEYQPYEGPGDHPCR